MRLRPPASLALSARSDTEPRTSSPLALTGRMLAGSLLLASFGALAAAQEGRTAELAPSPAAGLSPSGWTIMLGWLAFVITFTGWCYWRVLHAPISTDARPNNGGDA